MKSIICTVLIGLLCTAGAQTAHIAPPSNTTVSVNRIVAVVNDDIITEHELQVATTLAMSALKSSNAPMPNAKTLRKNILDNLIMRRLQLTLAKNNQITASAAEVQHAIAAIAAHNQLSTAAFKVQLQQQKIPFSTFKRNITEQIIINQLQQAVLHGKVSISPEKMRAFKIKLKKEKGITEYKITQYHSTSLAQAQKIIASFKKTHAVTGTPPTTWAFKSAEDLPDLFVAALKTMHTGDISAPIKTGNGYHVLVLTGTRTVAPTISESQLQQMLYEQEAQTVIQQWLEQLRKSAFIKIYD